jgi:hypothetical protein
VTTRERRDRRLLQITIWCRELGDQDALIRNLSKIGLGGRISNSPLPQGADVTVTFADGSQVTGAVRWVRGDAFGVRLQQDMDPAAIDKKLRQQFDAKQSMSKWEVHSHHRLQPEKPKLPPRRL